MQIIVTATQYYNTYNIRAITLRQIACYLNLILDYFNFLERRA